MVRGRKVCLSKNWGQSVLGGELDRNGQAYDGMRQHTLL